ncbi:MAG: FecR family protein [Bacteroidota bacterium]
MGFGLFTPFNSSVTTYTTAYGETQVITLEDGTLVTLNANSKLIHADNFGAQDRCVQFSGEGYFRVAKNPEKPFIIHTADSKTQVSGTAFNLRAILNRPTTLTLEEGKVAFSAIVDNEEIIVRPNK